LFAPIKWLSIVWESPIARIEMTYSVTMAMLSSKGVSGSSKEGSSKAGPKILPKVKNFYFFD
jgi:hypothetical protein